jgi:formate/nitrite transporter FocA (FNT family)
MLITIVDSLVRIYRPFLSSERKLALITLIILHTQLLIGIALYFVSPFVANAIESGNVMKDPVNRFYLVEHAIGMCVAIAFVTVGYSKAKKQSESWAKHKLIFTYYTIAFILILISIPWPFRMVGEGRGWF